MQTAIKGDLDKFLQGIPQNEVLETLRDELDEDSYAPVTIPELGELTDDDREHMRRMTLEPGWRIAIARFDRLIREQEQAQKALSLNDPLGNDKNVVKGWAYIAMLQRARAQFISVIEAEILQLNEKRTRTNR